MSFRFSLVKEGVIRREEKIKEEFSGHRKDAKYHIDKLRKENKKLKEKLKKKR